MELAGMVHKIFSGFPHWIYRRNYGYKWEINGKCKKYKNRTLGEKYILFEILKYATWN